MAVHFAQDGQDRDSSGKILWQEHGQFTDITFATPFGNTVAQVHLSPTEATFKGSDGSVVSETTPDMLFYRLFGMDLPIANLHDWIGSSNTPLQHTRDENGWQVRIGQTFANPNLAKSLDISRQSPNALTMSVWIDRRSDANDKTSPPDTDEVDIDRLLPKKPVATPPKNH